MTESEDKFFALLLVAITGAGGSSNSPGAIVTHAMNVAELALAKYEDRMLAVPA